MQKLVTIFNMRLAQASATMCLKRYTKFFASVTLCFCSRKIKDNMS